MRIGITLDGVVRDFITKFESVYDKYYPVEEGEETPERKIENLNLLEHFEFSGGTTELNKTRPGVVSIIPPSIRNFILSCMYIPLPKSSLRSSCPIPSQL